MKKFFLMISLLFLLTALTIPVYAEDYWTITYHGSGNTDRSKYFMELTTQYKYGDVGTKSMLIKYPGIPDDNYVELKNNLTTPMDTGKYILTFYMKGNRPSGNKISVGDQRIFDIKDIEDGTENGWYKYSVSFDYEKQEESFVSFRVYKISTAAIDCMSLVKEGSTENLIADYSFEGTEDSGDTGGDGNTDGESGGNTGGNENTDSESGGDTGSDGKTDSESEYTADEYQPTRLMATEKDGAIVLNWKNPQTSDLTKVRLYDVTNGESTLLADSISALPGTLVYHTINRLKNGSKYQYKLVFSYSTRSDETYFVSGTPNANASVKYGAWTLGKVVTGKAGYAPVTGKIDYDDAHGGDASFKFVSNIDRTYKENEEEIFKSNIYINLYNELPLTIGKTYEISLWMKRVDFSGSLGMHMSWVAFDNKAPLNHNITGTSDGWEKKTFKYTYTGASGANVFRICLDTHCEALWIDDVECYELDGDERLGTNLVGNGDFEGLVSEEVGTFGGITAKAEIKAGVIELNIPSDKYAGAEIYKRGADGKYQSRGNIAQNVKKIKIDSLDGKEEYTYRFIPINSNGCKGKPVDVSFVTGILDYEIGDITLKKGADFTNVIWEAGSYIVSVPIKNNELTNGFIYEQIVALYKDKKLVDISSTSKTIEKSEKNTPSVITSTRIDVPEDEGGYGGYRIRVFLVDSRETFNLYEEPAQFNGVLTK